ncbi:MAG: GerMN domain-containing protein [Oscillospiraceae bacterium]|jgi:germination protein M|nr:GerMN domain-containing protein [Oscillospiraceae bacterium]
MKRILVALFALCLLFSSCRKQDNTDIASPFSFYHIAAQGNETVISSQIVSLDANNLPLKEVVLRYMQEPAAQGLWHAIPAALQLESCEKQGETAVIVFKQRGVLAKIDRTLAFACLSKTILQLDGIERVSLSTDLAGETVVLTQKDILLIDTGAQDPLEDIVLYFADADRRYLVRETQSVAPIADKPRYIMEQLLSLHDANALRSGIPAGTRLLDINVQNGVCTVDLSSEFVENMAEDFAAERMAVYSIVNSLTQLPEISTVDFWVSGAPQERLRFLDLRMGVARNEQVIVAPSGEDVLDATLYCVCNEELVEVPRAVSLSQDSTTAQQLLEALLAFESVNGIANAVPQGTKILSLRIENNLCVVDFTREFIDGCQTAQQEDLAARAVIATLTALEDITSVEILVEGLTPQ